MKKQKAQRSYLLGLLALSVLLAVATGLFPIDGLWSGKFSISQRLSVLGLASALCLLSYAGLLMFKSEQQALIRFEKAARKLVERDRTTVFADSDYEEFPGLVRVVNDLIDQLDEATDTQRALSEIDSLILDGTELAVIIRRCLIAARLDGLEVRLLFRQPAQPDQLYMHYLRGLKVETEAVSQFALVHQKITTLEHFWSLIDNRFSDLKDMHPVALDEYISGVLFATGFREIRPIESKRLTDLADRLSVALTNITRAETLYQQAHFDALTGLLNRRAFEDRLKESLLRSRRNETGVLLFIDLDGFKKVNDSEGHEAGDKILVRVAEGLRDALRPEDTIARLGGDEFAVIAPGVSDQDAISAICERIIKIVDGPMVVDRMEHDIGTSIGVARYPHDGFDLDQIIMKADSAMYRAKETGGSQYAFFDDSLKEASDRRNLVESRLRHAIKGHDLQMHFQPKLDLKDWSLGNCEALLRWRDDELGVVNPKDFIGVAEETGLIHNIMPLLVEGAGKALNSAKARGIELDSIALNASPKQIMSEGFAMSLLSMLDLGRLPHEKIEVEVTESVLVENMAQVLSELHILRLAGIKVALDDFGTGYSSLNMLRQLPLDTVKIDRSFITELESSDEARRMLKHLIDIAKVLGLKVVAEGVETDMQLQYLLDHDCDMAQGFLIAKALKPEDYFRMVAEWGDLRPIPRNDPHLKVI